MGSFESKLLLDCPNDFKSVFYRRYINEIFVLFSSPDHSDKFREYLSSKHPNIKFSIEKDQDGCLPFLDINLFRENQKFAIYKNSYPRDLIDKRIREFLNKILAQNLVVSTVPKKNLVIALPYLRKLFLQIRTRINCIMKNKLPYCNIRFVFQSKCKISNVFTLKDKIPSFSRSNIVYKFKCGSCNATYYGKSKRHFKVRMCEHLGISALNGKRV